MKTFKLLMFVILINSIFGQSTISTLTSPSPLSWTDLKLQITEKLKNFNDQNKPKIYNEIEEIWKVSCEKVKNERIDEITVLNFVESLNNVMPKASSNEVKNGIKFHLTVLLSNKNCRI